VPQYATQSIVKLIDHSVLQPTQTEADVRAACEFCAALGVASVCVKPSFVPLAAECLAGSDVLVSTVAGFPHGGATTQIKVAETHLACEQGAVEIDMVANLGKALSGDWDFVAADIQAVVDAARSHGAITKVILETGLLPNDEVKIRLCQVSEAAGAAFVKTSTGYGVVKGEGGALAVTGATEHDVKLMRAACGPTVQIKAAGGMRTYADARRFVELGATRLGTSSTQAIAAGERGERATSTTNY
jgi:deoxyribose-phosphate aldolase